MENNELMLKIETKKIDKNKYISCSELLTIFSNLENIEIKKFGINYKFYKIYNNNEDFIFIFKET
jgi:hypothetical protein